VGDFFAERCQLDDLMKAGIWTVLGKEKGFKGFFDRLLA
jgi:hypothetical protein